MSNYTKTVNFAAKDSLPSGDAAKIVKGTEIDTEFNNIATAVATKADSGVITDGTVTTAKLADDAVTAAKLAASAVVTASIVDDNVTQAKIADDAVGADQLAANAVVTASIADDAVTGDKLANNITIAGELVVTGDLTVSGDDITMGTNTSGNLLIADGSNFNSVAVGSLSEISTVAGDDVFLAVDTSGGGLKKITRSTVVAGLATSSAISNVVEDTSPQLGGDLDAQSKDITAVGILTANSSAGVYGSSSSPVVFTVTVASKTSAHPYNGDGSSSGYFLNGIESPAISLHGADSVTANSEYVYRFDQADGSNSGHPLLFYMDAAKTTAYTTGVTTNGTPGSAGAYTQIAVDKETPSVLYYQCSSHAYMGNYAYNAASTNLNGIKMPTADGSSGQVLTTNGSGTLSFADAGGGAYNDWLVKTSAYTAVAGDQIIVNSSSATTITLPASASAGNTVIIKATGGGTVTIGRNSQKINSTAADGTLLSGSSTQLVFVDATIGFLEI